jgi:hypothetical protein
MIYLPDDSIPDILYNALVKSNQSYYEETAQYLKGKHFDHHLSNTKLIGPAQKAELFKRHNKEMYVRPIKDLWASFIGTCIHLILELEAKKDPNYWVEFRVGIDIRIDGKIVHIHGMLDLYDKSRKMISDWKITRPTSLMYDKTEHIMQLNVLRYLMIRNGYEVNEIEDVYMFPHLDNTKLSMEGYPQQNAVRVKVPILPEAEVKKYIFARARHHIANMDKPDKELEPCTDAERWIRGSMYKVYFRKAPKNKKDLTPEFSSKATHTFMTRLELEEFQVTTQTKASNYQIREIKGSAIGCEYCSSAPFCHQLKQERKQFLR